MIKIFFTLIFSSVLLIMLIFAPEICIEAAKKSTSDFFGVIFPSLFPFMFASTLFIKTGLLQNFSFKFEKFASSIFGAGSDFIYIFLCSMISGYPLGAKLSCDLFKAQTINKNSCIKTINATSMSGPLFISGVVCLGIFGTPQLFAYIYFPHVLSAFLTGVLLRKTTGYTHLIKNNNSELNDSDITKSISDAFSSCFKTLLIVFGYILIFSVITSVIFINADKNIFTSICIGLFEMSNGILSLNNISGHLFEKIIAAEFIITFGGFSVIMQTYSIMASNKIKNAYFLPAKLLQTAIAVLLCMLFISISDINSIFNSLPV